MLIVFFLSALSEEQRDIINDIYLKHNIRLYNISMKILNSQADAEEAVAQTFLNIIKHIDKISELSSSRILPYCITIVKNESIAIIRKRKKAVNIEDVDQFELVKQSDCPDEIRMRENSEELYRCIMQLPDEDRHLIQLRFAMNMDYERISRLMGISEEAARKRGQRIIKKLRLIYQGEQRGVGRV